jgi:hypothetical protein
VLVGVTMQPKPYRVKPTLGLVIPIMSLLSLLLPGVANANPALRYQGQSMYRQGSKVFVVTTEEAFVNTWQIRPQIFRPKPSECGVIALPSSYVRSESLGIYEQLPIVEVPIKSWACRQIEGLDGYTLVPLTGYEPTRNRLIKIGNTFYLRLEEFLDTAISLDVGVQSLRRVNSGSCGFIAVEGAYRINNQPINFASLPEVEQPPICISGVALVPQAWTGARPLTYQGSTVFRDANDNFFFAATSQVTVKVSGQVKDRLVRTDACGTFSIQGFTPPENVFLNGVAQSEWRVLQNDDRKTTGLDWKCVNGQNVVAYGWGYPNLPAAGVWVRTNSVGGLVQPTTVPYRYYGLAAPNTNIAVRYSGTDIRRISPNACGLATLRNSKTEPFSSVQLMNANTPVNAPQIAVAPQCRGGVLYVPTNWVY